MLHDIKKTLELKVAAQNSFEASSGGLWHWDLESHHINWSTSFKAMLGLNPDWQVDRQAWQEMMHPDDRETTVAKIRNYLEKKSDTYDHVYRIQHADSSYRWVHSQGKAAWNADGKAIIIAGTTQDITDIVALHDALKDHEDQFRLLANSMPHLAWLADRTGRALWYNRLWHDYTGVAAERVQEYEWQKLHDPLSLIAAQEQWDAGLQKGERFNVVLSLRGKDGIFRLFATRVSPVTDAGSNVSQWFGTHTQLTGIK